MPKKPSPDISLTKYNEIFDLNNKSSKNSDIVQIQLSELHPPEIHPFLVKNDAAMKRLSKNIAKHGVLEPGLARPRPDGGYELLSGNRRKFASELAGLTSMPIIIRELDDDTAAIVMVDCNLEQREVILPSEKAAAYKVKMDALSHKGIKDEKQSVDILIEQTGESRSQIFRMLRITELIIELAEKLDDKKLGFSSAVDLSHLSVSEQKAVADVMNDYDIKPSVSQSSKLKRLKNEGKLTVEMIESILSVNKGITKQDRAIAYYSKYFPDDYTTEQMNKVIVGLLEGWSSEKYPDQVPA